MENVLIPCPRCGKELKLRDRKLLGRKGKCPQCQHRFILEEPDEVQLELADEAPAVGTSAQWVPDNAAAPASVATAPRQSAPATPGPIVNVDEPAPVGSSRLQATKQRRKQQLKLGLIVGSIASAVVLAGIIWASRSPTKGSANDEKSKKSNAQLAGKSPSANGTPGIPAPPKNTLPAPPKGEPIKLNYMPFGARMVIHLHPAKLWKAGSPGETMRFSLGPLGTWTGEKLKEVLLFEPSEIEEALICLYMDDLNRPPDYAYRVKLVARQKPSTFIEKFAGKSNVDHGVKIYVRDAVDNQPSRAFMITDQAGQEFASAPAAFSQEMIDSAQNPGLPSGGLQELLNRSDSNRHLTILFEPKDLSKGRRFLFPSSTYDLLGQFLDRFESTKMETVMWSFHFGNNEFPEMRSEMLLRNVSELSPRELQLDMQRKLENLPNDLVSVLQLTRPRHMADRKLVGRLPVMTKAFQIETVSTIGTENDRYVKLTTVLPGIAAPNLGAAGVFAWNLIASTDFSKPPPSAGGKPPKLAKTVAGRLKKAIEVDFRRLPLQNAFDYIGTETSVKTDIDGDALKDSGFTKNMAQVMNLGTIPADKALAKIIKQYKDMVVVVDEPKKTIILTTRKFAEKKMQTILPLGP